MSHPRIEEVSDSEDVASDPSEGDIDDFNEADILMRKGSAASRSSSQAPIPSQTGGGAPQHILKPEEMQKIMMQQQAAASTGGAIKQQQQADMSKYCDYQHLYPVYFDAARSRAQGRRVSRSLAVENPLAREIVNACARLQLDTLFEPGKTHPKDWANPGRVRVGLKDSPLWQEEDKSKVRGEGIKNKHHLYVLIAQHLQENPTTESCPSLRNVRVGGIPVPDIGVKEEGENGKKKGWPRAQMPRGKGWKAGELLPHWSPALTGGGVSDNLLGVKKKNKKKKK